MLKFHLNRETGGIDPPRHICGREYHFGEDENGVYFYCPTHRIKYYSDENGDWYLKFCNPPQPKQESARTRRGLLQKLKKKKSNGEM